MIYINPEIDTILLPAHPAQDGPFWQRWSTALGKFENSWQSSVRSLAINYQDLDFKFHRSVAVGSELSGGISWARRTYRLCRSSSGWCWHRSGGWYVAPKFESQEARKQWGYDFQGSTVWWYCNRSSDVDRWSDRPGIGHQTHPNILHEGESSDRCDQEIKVWTQEPIAVIVDIWELKELQGAYDGKIFNNGISPSAQVPTLYPTVH